MENIMSPDPGESSQFLLTQSMEALVLPLPESHYSIMLTSLPRLFLLKPVLVSCICLEIFPFYLKSWNFEFILIISIYNITLSFLTMSEYKVIYSFSVLIMATDAFSYLLDQFHQKYIYFTSSLKKNKFWFCWFSFQCLFSSSLTCALNFLFFYSHFCFGMVWFGFGLFTICGVFTNFLVYSQSIRTEITMESYKFPFNFFNFCLHQTLTSFC